MVKGGGGSVTKKENERGNIGGLRLDEEGRSECYEEESEKRKEGA